MRILIVTPLYPPDIKEPAPYVKELATRLKDTHEVTILAYNHHPEKVPGVTIMTVEKSANTPLRLLRFFLTFRSLAKTHDVLFVQNGPSVELPVLFHLLISPSSKRKTVLRLGDHVPLTKSGDNLASRITRELMKHVKETLSHEDTCELCKAPSTVIPRPLPRPELLPFRERDAQAHTSYETSWREHTATLEKFFAS